MVTKHASKRMKERYGEIISAEEDARIMADIDRQNYVYLIGDKHTATYAVIIDHKAVPVVVDKKNKRLITVLPRKAMFSMLTRRLHDLTRIHGGSDEIRSMEY